MPPALPGDSYLPIGIDGSRQTILTSLFGGVPLAGCSDSGLPPRTGLIICQ